MLRAKRLLTDRERPLVERSRAGEIALGLTQVGEVVEVSRNFRIPRPVNLSVDRQCALEERTCAGEVALGLKEARKVVEALRDVGMLGTERVLANRKRPFM